MMEGWVLTENTLQWFILNTFRFLPLLREKNGTNFQLRGNIQYVAKFHTVLEKLVEIFELLICMGFFNPIIFSMNQN